MKVLIDSARRAASGAHGQNNRCGARYGIAAGKDSRTRRTPLLVGRETTPTIRLQTAGRCRKQRIG